jgi:hypothetical protein
MTAARDLSTPYVDGLPDSGVPMVRVVFTGVAGEAKGSKYVIAGFWDGGKTWRARFTPPLPGV